jgi:hypothetical protein
VKRQQPIDDVPQACANCGQGLDLPVPWAPPAFCPACGQETRVRAPRLMEFLQQLGGAYFSTEGALWRTLKLLLFKPGELTVRYLAGQRKHYVLPLRLYLTISVLVLVLMRTLAGSSIEFNMPGDLDLRKGEYSIFSFGDGSGAGMKGGVFFCNSLPQWVCKRLQRRLDVDPKGLQNEAAAMGERFVSNMGASMFVVMPLFALFQKMVYWNRRMRYTEHLVFALHLHAFWFAVLSLTLFNLSWLTGLAVLAVPVYGFMALKRVYGGGRIWRFLRVCLVSLLYLVSLTLAMTAAILWSLIF